MILLVFQYYGTIENLIVMIGFVLVAMFIGTKAFERMRS